MGVEDIRTRVDQGMTTVHETSIQIEGMSCASCVGRVEKTLNAVPGVTEATVNLANETVRLSYDERANLPELTRALEVAGYPAVVEEVMLDITGMTCASCVGRVEKALKSVEGVVDASVNLATETATIRYVAGATTPVELAEIVTKAGYPSKFKTGSSTVKSDRKAEEAARLARRTILAAVLTLPVFLLEMGRNCRGAGP